MRARLLLLGMGLVILGALAVWTSGRRNEGDLRVYYDTVGRIVRGLDLYHQRESDAPNTPTAYIYPPAFAVLFLPLTALPFPAVRGIWFFLMGLCAIRSYWIGARLELRDTKPFGRYQSIMIGISALAGRSRDELVRGLEAAVAQTATVIPAGPEAVDRVAIVSGAGSDFIGEASERGIRTLITGEASHHAYFEAEELGVNLILGGHYATETPGVQRLAEMVGERFDVPWEFIDHPTGM